MKLFPLFGSAIAFLLVHTIVLDRYVKLVNDAKQGNFDDLEVIHHISSGMKSFQTQTTYDGMMVIRQSIGGAGYSAWSALPSMIEDFSGLPTAEGDNTVMSQ